MSTSSSTSAATTSVRDLRELRFGYAGFLLLVVVTGCHVVGAGVPQATTLAGLCCATSCLTLPLRHALVVGLTAWGLVTGFVVNELGVLTFTHADLLRLVALVALAAGGAAATTARQSQPRRRNTAYSAPHISAIRSRANG